MSKSYSPAQVFEAKQLSVDLLDRPEEFYMHNRRYSASVIMQVVYGRRIPTCEFLTEYADIGDCEEIRQIYGILGRFAGFRRPGAYLVDVLPELESIPFFDLISPWKKVANDIFQKDSAVYETYWKQMKKEIEQGTAPHSWGKEFVQSNYGKHGVDEMGAIYTAYIHSYPSEVTVEQ
jgi:hypothetical protein